MYKQKLRSSQYNLQCICGNVHAAASQHNLSDGEQATKSAKCTSCPKHVGTASIATMYQITRCHQADSSKEPHKKILDKNISKSPHAIVCPSSCKVQYSPTMYKHNCIKCCQALSTISSVFAANLICKMHKLYSPQARRNCIKCNIVPDYKMHQADSSKEPHKKILDKNISKSPHAIVCPSSCKVQYSPTMYKHKLPSS